MIPKIPGDIVRGRCASGFIQHVAVTRLWENTASTEKSTDKVQSVCEDWLVGTGRDLLFRLRVLDSLIRSYARQIVICRRRGVA